jgi:hypothetical protein
VTPAPKVRAATVLMAFLNLVVILNLLDVAAPGPSRLGARRLSFSYCIHEPELTMNGKATVWFNAGGGLL